MDLLWSSVAAIMDQIVVVLTYPFQSDRRLYWVYLLTSLLCAYAVYRSIRAKGSEATAQDAENASGTFVQFLFPKSVWSHPSAWLDLRYFVFHRVAQYFLLFGTASAALALAFHFGSGGLPVAELVVREARTGVSDWIIALAVLAVITVVSDFIGWFIHFLQHKIPLLWQFHKVHHSAEVMHPISNFREHPVDNLFYGIGISAGFGLCIGLTHVLFGYMPTVPTLLGIPAFMFLFNIVGYNLRHSHVWLKWPGLWSKVFPSSAHHHVHHSCHPDHIDKNFAFMFPVWDVIFGTYIMPQDNRDVKFGVPEEEGRDLDGVLRLYWVPFRDAYRLFVPKRAIEQDQKTQATTDGIAAE